MPVRPDPRSTGDRAAALRDAIRRIADQRVQARAEGNRALVTAGQVKHAVRRQHTHLAAARDEIDDSVRAATLSAESARAEALAAARNSGQPEHVAAALAATAAAPYEQTRAELLRQRTVLDDAAEQLAAVDLAATEQITRNRALVTQSLRSLDAALRNEVALLVQLERLDRARAIERARRGKP